jgi:hypothetical protein
MLSTGNQDSIKVKCATPCLKKTNAYAACAVGKEPGGSSNERTRTPGTDERERANEGYMYRNGGKNR